MDWTGHEAAIWQEASRRTTVEFAKAVGVSPDAVERWRRHRGDRTPRKVTQRLLDADFAAADPQDKARFVRLLNSTSVPSAQAVETTDAAGRTDFFAAESAPVQDSDDLSEWKAVNRRILLKLLGGVALSPAAAALLGLDLDPDEIRRLTGGLASARRVDAASLDHIEAILKSLREQSDTFGPQLVLPAISGQLTLAESLMANCPPSLRARLFGITAGLARAQGWMQFDCRDFAAATDSYTTALTAAHEAGDDAEAAMIKCNQAYLAAWTNDPRHAIDSAVAAQVWATKSGDPRLRAYVHAVAGYAHARHNDRTACMTALDAADEAVADAAGAYDNTESLAPFAGPGLVANFRADCLHRLGARTEAHRAAELALTLIAPDHVRNRALAHLDLSNSLVALNEIEAAADAITDAADLALTCRSDRLTEQVATAHSHLRPWQSHTRVRDLDKQLTDYGLVGSART